MVRKYVYHLEAPHPPLMTYSFSLSAVMQKKKSVSWTSLHILIIFSTIYDGLQITFFLPDKTLPEQCKASSVPEAITFKRSANLYIN
jgi:hypothetical protein